MLPPSWMVACAMTRLFPSRVQLRFVMKQACGVRIRASRGSVDKDKD